MKLALHKGVTSQTTVIFVPDSSASDGSGLTGLAYDSSGLSWYYYREAAGTGATQVTLATMTLGTWASGGFIVVDGTNMPGCYEIGIPNACLADGADFVTMELKGATNMAPVLLEIELLDHVHQAKVWLTDDDSGSKDRYVVIWHRDGIPTISVSNVKIQVIKAIDGTDLVAETAMTQIGTTAAYRYDEATNRVDDGAAYVVKATATINGATRTWYQPVSRDG